MSKKLENTLKLLLTGNDPAQFLNGEFLLRRHLAQFTYCGETQELLDELDGVFKTEVQRLGRTFMPRYAIIGSIQTQNTVSIELYRHDASDNSMIRCGSVEVILLEKKFDYALKSLRRYYSLRCKNAVTLRTALMEPVWRERILKATEGAREMLSHCLDDLDQRDYTKCECGVEYDHREGGRFFVFVFYPNAVLQLGAEYFSLAGATSK